MPRLDLIPPRLIDLAPFDLFIQMIEVEHVHACFLPVFMMNAQSLDWAI